MAAGLLGKPVMYLIFVKFIEVFTRAAFVVGTTYSLKLAGAGQFGVVITLIGLFAFAFNWERHIDLQRRYADASPEIFDRAVMAALPFWGFNQALMIPVFATVVGIMGHLTSWQIFLAVAIVSCEQITNQTYQMALITRRYWDFLNIVAVKNVLVLAAVLPYVIFAPSKLTLNYVLATWAIGQVSCAAAIFAMWWRRKCNAPHERPFTWRERIFSQHRASFTHYQIGAVAIVALQFDRLTVGSLLPLEVVGNYFRHVLAVSFVYQFFNVASYNRIVPRVFTLAKTQPNSALWIPIRRELAMVFATVGIGFLGGVAIDASLGGVITRKYSLSIPLAVILLLAALMRVTADFAAMICHARHREGLVLRAQATTFACGAVLLVALTWRFGVFGTATASAINAGLLLLIVLRSIRKLPESLQS